MAKLIQFSDDNGSNWFTFPGGGGSFSREATPIEDTILGATYQSQFPGLLGWNVQVPGIYKGYAGYVAEIKKAAASPTATAGEACTLVSGKTYQINDTTKRIWDRTATITVYDGVTDETAEVVSIDYLFGKVTFDSAFTPAGAVTVDVSYFATSAIGKANSFTLTQTANLIETSDFATVQANSGYRTFQPGLRTVSIDLSGFFDSAADFAAELVARNELIIEINPDGAGLSLARGFFYLVGNPQSGDVGAIEEETLSFALSVPDDSLLAIPYGWSHDDSSTLSSAIVKALTAWEDETLGDVQYLHDGTNGWKGDCVVSECTLSGGLEQMNEFSFTLNGSGGITDVP